MGNDFSKKISSLTQNNNKINVSSNVFAINSDALATHYSDRYNFYIQWLASIKSDNPDVFNKLMEIYSLYVEQNKKIEGARARLINDIGDTPASLDALKKKLQTTVYKDFADKINVGTKAPVKAAVPQVAQEVAVTDKKEPALEGAATAGGGQSTINSTEGNYIFQEGGDVKKIVEDLHKSANNYPKKDDETKAQIMKDYNNITDTDDKIKLAELIYKDPLLNPENENVRLVDRGIFIALTYIIRVISLFITEWGIFTGFISSFAGAFNMYFITYICIFLLIVLITNSSSKNIVFKVLLYYLNTSTNDGKGIPRILLHIVCILLILPIPYIVKDYSIADKNKTGMSYAERANIISGVDKFSLYAWIITSSIAFYL